MKVKCRIPFWFCFVPSQTWAHHDRWLPPHSVSATTESDIKLYTTNLVDLNPRTRISSGSLLFEVDDVNSNFSDQLKALTWDALTVLSLGLFAPGLVTNSILFYWLFKIMDRCKKVRFQQTHNPGMRQLFLDGVLGPPRLVHFCSSGGNARGESRALEGRCVSSKSPSRVRDGDEGVAGRNKRE